MWFSKKDTSENYITTKLTGEQYIAIEKFREEQRIERMKENNKSCNNMLLNIFTILFIVFIMAICFVVLSSPVNITYSNGDDEVEYRASTLVYMNDDINDIASFGHPDWIARQGCGQ